MPCPWHMVAHLSESCHPFGTQVPLTVSQGGCWGHLVAGRAPEEPVGAAPPALCLRWGPGRSFPPTPDPKDKISTQLNVTRVQAQPSLWGETLSGRRAAGEGSAACAQQTGNVQHCIKIIVLAQPSAAFPKARGGWAVGIGCHS